MEYHFSDAYALVAATDMKVFFELRSYDQDQVLDSMVLSSRYMIPEFEAIDAGKRGPQFMVQTRDGGTGLGECAVGPARAHNAAGRLTIHLGPHAPALSPPTLATT